MPFGRFLVSFDEHIIAGSAPIFANKGQAPLTEEEFVRFRGILLMMCLFDFGDRKNWWTTTGGTRAWKDPISDKFPGSVATDLKTF